MTSRSHQSNRSRSRSLGLLIAAAALLGTTLSAAAAVGQDPAAAGARARYEQERARCLTGESGQAKETCLREAGAALQAARQGQLDDRGAIYQQNALQRCKPLPPADAKDCRDRILGQGTVSGSVKGGGLYREKVTVEIGEPPQPSAEAPVPSTMPPDQPTSPPPRMPPPPQR